MPDLSRATKNAAPNAHDLALGARTLAKVTRRLLPFMFLLYIVGYLDRINVSFAALQMKQDLHLSDAVYGFGAGIFFYGYFLFEIPSNLIMERVGARVWMARIMVTWGVIASSMMFMTGGTSFCLLRFLLGVAEAGFFPGMILYLTYWFPAEERAKSISKFMMAGALAGVVGGPISGALLALKGIGGLAGWQWLFLIEGIPAVLLGFVTLSYLTDRPEQARWLEPEEKEWLARRLAREREHRETHSRLTLAQVFSHGKVWALCLLYFVFVVASYGLSFWLPQIIKASFGSSDRTVSTLFAIPYVVSAIAMVLVGNHSDRTGERRWHIAISAFIGAAGFALSAALHSPPLVLAAITVGAVGVWSACGTFWTLPTAFLGGTAAAGGIALINSVGNLGGFAGPVAVGLVKRATSGFTWGLLTLALMVFIGGVLVLCIRHDPALEGFALLKGEGD